MYRVIYIDISFTIILLYLTLSQDNSNVRLEERIWWATRQRPGDIYHPGFLDGHPDYFVVSVRNTLQPGNHNRASTDAVSAAIAGEMEKNSKHAASVEAVGGRFFPLVTETLGVWTPFFFVSSLRETLCAMVSRRPQLNPATFGKAVVVQCQDDPISLWSPAENGPSFKNIC